MIRVECNKKNNTWYELKDYNLAMDFAKNLQKHGFDIQVWIVDQVNGQQTRIFSSSSVA